MTRSSSVVCWMVGMLMVATASAQDTVSVATSGAYRFISDEHNVIGNTPSLSGFFDKLYQLKKSKKGLVSVLHIGDSHVQADWNTHTTRQLLQREFGNAGRGFIFPGRVARTNEPQNISTSSRASWEAKRIVFSDQPLPIGLGALTVQTRQADAKFSVRTLDAPGLSYRFNQVAFFYKKDFASFNLAVNDSAGHTLAYVGPYTREQYPNYSLVCLPYSVREIECQVQQPTDQQTEFTLFGLSLTNGSAGVCYHSIGGNGAKFKHYVAARYFAEQTAALTPDLVIISLGTNEAIEYPYVDKFFATHVDSLIDQLKKANPQTQFVLTTPADFYRKRTRRNPGVDLMHTQLTQIAERRNIALWDLYAAGGGKHSADAWRKSGLMQSDGVHFTKAGYELQGSLLYQALMKAYNEYVRYRYP